MDSKKKQDKGDYDEYDQKKVDRVLKNDVKYKIQPELDDQQAVPVPDITNEYLEKSHLREVYTDDYSFIGPLIYKYHMKLKRFDKELYSKCLGQQHV